MVSDTIRFPKNDKDVSLALEMTIRESDIPTHSRRLIPSY